MRRTWIGLALAAAVVAGLPLTACGSDGNGIGTCQQLESARCVYAQKCGLDLAFPLHSGSSPEDNIQACQLFYQDACLHGLVTSISPTEPDVSRCLAEINTGNCTAVVNPQLTTACAWLNPPDAGVDAGSDVSTTTDAVVVVVEVPDATVDAGVDSNTCDTTCESQCIGDPTCIMMCGC